MHYDFRRAILITTKTSKATTASAGPYRLRRDRAHRAEHIKGAFASGSLGLGLARRGHGWRGHGWWGRRGSGRRCWRAPVGTGSDRRHFLVCRDRLELDCLLGVRLVALKRCAGRSCGFIRRRCLGSTETSLGESIGDAADELVQQLVTHVRDHAPAELRRLSGDRQIGEHLDLGLIAISGELGSHCGGCRPIAALVLAASLDHYPPLRVVAFHVSTGPRVNKGDRTQLDLHGTRELITFDAADRGAWGSRAPTLPGR